MIYLTASRDKENEESGVFMPHDGTRGPSTSIFIYACIYIYIYICVNIYIYMYIYKLDSEGI